MRSLATRKTLNPSEDGVRPGVMLVDDPGVDARDHGRLVRRPVARASNATAAAIIRSAPLTRPPGRRCAGQSERRRRR